MVTPQAAAATPIDVTMARRVSIGIPSSMTKAAVRAMGTAPRIARSLTVPCTASDPMSPPGKTRGLTTKESVLITTAPDRSAAEAGSATTCLLYTSDAADEEDSVDLGGRRIIKKKKKKKKKK